jgi:hypothetical protein
MLKTLVWVVLIYIIGSFVGLSSKWIFWSCLVLSIFMAGREFWRSLQPTEEKLPLQVPATVESNDVKKW